MALARWPGFAAVCVAAGCSLIYETSPLTDGSSQASTPGGTSSAGSGASNTVAGGGTTSGGTAQGGTTPGGSASGGTGNTGSASGGAGDDGNGNGGAPDSGGSPGAGGACAGPYYPDDDEDGYGDDSQPGVDCQAPGYAPAGDCDDDEYYRNPELSELCDGIDNDCDATTPDECPLDCETDDGYMGQIFMFCLDGKPWLEASAVCASQHMRLARFESDPEQTYVFDWLAPEFAWIGGTDAETEGVWRWEDGEVFWDHGTMTGYQDWGGVEPNDLDMSEDCLLLNGDWNHWNDNVCAYPFNFVCERY